MTVAGSDRPWHAKLPNWLLPALVCGGLPSLLFLFAACVVFVVWLFSGATEPDIVQTAAHPPADVAPAVASSSASSLAAATTTPQAASTTTVEVPERAAPPTKAAATVEANAKPPAAADSGPRRVQYLMLAPPDNVNSVAPFASNYAYDYNTGQLGILGPWENAVGFISIEDQPRQGMLRDVKHVPLRGVPHALKYQQLPNGGGVFVIAQTKATGIIFVDAKSLEIVKALKLDSFPTFMWASGKTDPQYLYFTTEMDRSQSQLLSDEGSFLLPNGWTVQMQRLDLVSMEFDTRFQGEMFNTSDVRVLGEQVVRYFTDIVYLDHDRRFIAYENGVFSASGGRKLTNLSFQAQWFLGDGALLTGVANSEIVVGSINDGRVVAGVSLPDVYERMLGRAAELGRGHVFAKIFVDPKRKSLVVGRRQHVIIIPLETLGLPDEPILLLDERPPTAVAVGQQYQFDLRTVSGEGSFTLVEGPEGMTMQDGVLRWRPDVAYTAPVEVKVKTSANDVTREESWNITVE